MITILDDIYWSGREDLNLRPPAPKAGALNQAALRPDIDFIKLFHAYDNKHGEWYGFS